MTITKIGASWREHEGRESASRGRPQAAGKKGKRRRRRKRRRRGKARRPSALDSSRGISELSERMPIAENWSRLRGRVEAWDPPKKAGDPGTLTIVVDRVDDVAAADGSRHRNMLSRHRRDDSSCYGARKRGHSDPAAKGFDRRRRRTAGKGARSVLRAPRAHQVDVQVADCE